MSIKFPNIGERVIFDAEVRSKNKQPGNYGWEITIEPLDFDDGGKIKTVKKLIFKNLGFEGIDVNNKVIKVNMINSGNRIVINGDWEGFWINFNQVNVDDKKEVAVGRKGGGSRTASASRMEMAVKVDDDAKIEIVPTEGGGGSFNLTATSTPSTRKLLSKKNDLIRDCENNATAVFDDLKIDKDLFKKLIDNFSDEEITEKFYKEVETGRPIFSANKLRNWTTENKSSLTKNNSTTSTGTTNIATTDPDTNNKENKSTSSDLSSLRSQVISAINSVLNQDPKLNDNDLDSTYQGWKTKINNSNEESEIKSLKDEIIAHINSKRKEKQDDSNIADNLQKATNPNATPEDKKNALNEIEKNEGKSSYEKNEEQATNLKKEVAKNNPDEYLNDVVSNKIPTKLKNSEVLEGELGQPVQQKIKDLRDKKITEPEKIVEAEIEIFKEVGKVGADKKINNFKKQVEAVLKTKNGTEIEKLKKLLVDFINSNDVYYKAKKEQAEKLLSQLKKKTSSTNPTNSPGVNPLKIIIPLGLAGLALVGLIIFMVRRQKQKQTRLAEE